MQRFASFRGAALAAFLWTVCLSGLADGAPPSESLLPETTTGYLSIPQAKRLREHFQATQLGKLLQDPEMKPFVDDVRRQLREKLTDSGVRLGISLEDLEGISGGEICMAAIQPNGDKTQHAAVLLVDIKDHEQEANELLAKISANIQQQGGRRELRRLGETQVVVFTVPDRKQKQKSHTAMYFIHQGQLVAADHEPTLVAIHARLLNANGAGGTLATLPAFQQTMKRSSEAVAARGSTPEAQPDLRWFIDPFRYAEVMRASAGGRKKRGTDMLKVLANQGFTAVQALGGQVLLATEKHELEHHTSVFAPGTEKSNGGSGERYKLAARMLDFPNSAGLTPLPWVPQGLALHSTFNWRMQQAFWHAETLVDEIAGDKIFREVLESIEKDPNGPQINLEKELIRYLGNRATVVTDYRLPIGPKSERFLVAIEVSNPEAVAKAVNKAMEADPAAKRREFGGHLIWEVINEEEEVEVEALRIDGGGFGGDEEEEEEEKPMIPNSAVTVSGGALMVASHVDYIVEILRQDKGGKSLKDASDFQRVETSLNDLGSGEDSFRFFVRTDESYRTSYELMREGKMPEAETIVGRVLNRLLGPEEKGVLREQQIDGTKMPSFEVVRKYLGPSGFFVRSESDGWLISGCLLHRGEDSQSKE